MRQLSSLAPLLAQPNCLIAILLPSVSEDFLTRMQASRFQSAPLLCPITACMKSNCLGSRRQQRGGCRGDAAYGAGGIAARGSGSARGVDERWQHGIGALCGVTCCCSGRRAGLCWLAGIQAETGTALQRSIPPCAAYMSTYCTVYTCCGMQGQILREGLHLDVDQCGIVAGNKSTYM